MRYICMTACYWNKKRWEPEEFFEDPTDTIVPPKHFAFVSDMKKNVETRQFMQMLRMELTDLKKERAPHPATRKRIERIEELLEELKVKDDAGEKETRVPDDLVDLNDGSIRPQVVRNKKVGTKIPVKKTVKKA